MESRFCVYSLSIIGVILMLTNSCKKEDSKQAPLLIVSSVNDLTATTATSGGNITNDGGSTITLRGVCWSIAQNPTTASTKTTDGTGSGSFNSSITGLTPGTNYFLRAYAINAVGTGYSSQSTFTTMAMIPVLTTSELMDVTPTSATSGGNITNDGGAVVKARGICWSTHQNPTISDSITIDGLGLGSFKSSIIRLNPGLTYYFRAYAINSVGTGYGNQVTITTTAVIPTITTASVIAITSTTATSGGVIISDGGSTITARGVCWSTNQNPTIIDNKTNDGIGSNSFTSSLIGLTPGATYYIRAYAINSIGIVYGNQINITTTAILPLITTFISTPITRTTVECGGDIYSDGGSSIIDRGICWSTSQNPTITNNKTTDGSGIGSFNSSITGLTPGIHYYIRAYATNNIGTAYGGNISFTTPLYSIPTLTTIAASSITTITAKSGGTIISDGGLPITARGVIYWSASHDMTITTLDGSGNGSFTSNLIGLWINQTYYLKAYATNSEGTGYGNEIPIITSISSSETVSDIDGNIYHTVPIGTQVWMLENLKTTRYRDGISIPNITESTSWFNLNTPGYCWYNNDITNKNTYGALYNWYTVNSGKLCPTGWHVPSDAEWATLITSLGGASTAGGKMKEIGTSHWVIPNEEATNRSGFTALPGGIRYEDGSFSNVGNMGYWWSSTGNNNSALSLYLSYTFKETFNSRALIMGRGLSVRCIKD